MIDGLLVLGNGDLGARVEGIVGEGDREAGLEAIGSLNLPTADNRVNEPVHLITERFAFAEWKLVKTARCESIRHILIRDHPGWLLVAGIEIFGLLYPLRARVSPLNAVAFTESFAHAELTGVIPALAVIVAGV